MKVIFIMNAINTANVSVEDLSTHLHSYLTKVKQGKEFLILDNQQIVAYLVPNTANTEKEKALARLNAAKGTALTPSFNTGFDTDGFDNSGLDVNTDTNQWTADAHNL